MASARLQYRRRGVGEDLRAQDNVVDLALARGEVSVDRQRARDVGGVHRILAGCVDHHHIPGLHDVVIVRIVQHS